MAGGLALADLEPQLYRHQMAVADEGHGRTLPDGSTQWGGFPVHQFQRIKKLRNADRVMFLCPACFRTNGGAVGTHRIAIDFAGRGTPDEACVHNDKGQPVRWSVSGTGLADLTLSPSILMLRGCKWHGWVQNGQIKDA